jgi:uncharacterized protein (DUF1499 family)
VNALRVLPLLAFAAAAAVVVSGFGARFGAWNFGVGFQILRYGAYAGIAVAALSLIALLIPRIRAGHATTLAVALVVAFCAAAVPLYWMYQARSIPSINDITTDTANPPVFIAILPLRAGSRVSATYPGPATADVQRAGYPDIKPFIAPAAPAAAFEMALKTAREMGWEIVATDASSGRIEATATTPWFGFKDDVVVRVTRDGQGSRIDVRSLSRVGKGDLGANARRIRSYLAKMAA